MSPKTKPTKPIDVYVRVSDVKGRDVEAEGGTAAEQEKRCRAQLTALGLEVSPESPFTDLDVSGGKTSRPRFDVVKERIAAGESGGIIMLNLARFGRNRRVDEDILELEELGGTVISVEEKLDTSTPSGRFALTILSAVNTLYLENVRVGWAKANGNAVARGVKPGRTPCGYRRLTGGQLETDPETAPVVRAAFEARAKGGSWTQVAAILTDGTGKRWSLKATEKLTRNRSYLGELSWGGHTNFDPERAIVDNALFERVQRQRKNGTRHKRRAPGMLTGVAVCAGCGHRMTQDRNARTEFYRCSASHGVCDERANITHRIIEPWVAAQVIDFYLGAFERTDTPDDRTSELEAAIQAAETAFTEVEELRGQISPAAYAKGISAAEEALDTARDALAAYTPEAELPPRAILVRLKETADRDEAEAREELRELIARAVDKVEVHRGRGPVETRVSVYWADGNITGRDEPDILELLMNAKEES